MSRRTSSSRTSPASRRRTREAPSPRSDAELRSIELVLDGEADAAIRADWAALAAADLPSLASHAGESNRPHVTLVAGGALADSAALPSAFALPIAFETGGVMLFPTAKGRFVLVRPVVMTAELMTLQERVHATQAEVAAMTLPGAWSPHITLAMRLTAEQVASALPLLGAAPAGRFVGARLWDGVEKTVTALA